MTSYSGMTAYDDGPEDDLDGDDLDRETGGALRAKLVEALARIEELETANEIKTAAITSKSMDDAFEANGLSREEGLGKAIALAYEGEPDAEALAEHLLVEYGYEWAGEPHPMADAINLGQAQLDQISATAGSVPVTYPWDEELSKAEAAGDTQKTMAMKGQQVAGWFRP